MNNSPKELALPNIIAPGETYVLYETQGTALPSIPIEHIYFIKSNEEIMPALEMENTYYSEYELKKYIGWTKISPSCYEFKMLSYDKEEQTDIEHSLFLYRIKTFQEVLQEASGNK